MKQYGPHLLTKKVGTQEDLSRMVLCVDRLPAPNTVTDGTTMQLIKSQPGYTQTHFYRCELEPTPRWVDVTNDCGPTDRQMNDEQYRPHCDYEIFLGLLEGWASGYLEIWWKPVPDNPVAGPLSYELLVRKIGSYPASPGDGQVVVRRDASQSAFTEAHPYKFDDLAYGTDQQEQYHYRLFHVFTTGWYAYSDGPTSVRQI